MNFFLSSEGRLVDLKTISYSEAIFYLLCYYYCFNISYPAIYSEFLTAFQIYCLKEEAFVPKKGTNFRKFESNLKKFF
jgi:hypothetical protein